MSEEMKGITVKIDAELHAEVRQYLEEHSMTMAEFVAQALYNELHPKYQTKEQNNMENMRTVAFQVPEDLFQKIKDYLRRNNMSQKQFILGLIEDELEREQAEDFAAEDEEVTAVEETTASDDFEAGCEDNKDEERVDENEDTEYSDDFEDEDESLDESDDEDEDEDAGFCMKM